MKVAAVFIGFRHAQLILYAVEYMEDFQVIPWVRINNSWVGLFYLDNKQQLQGRVTQSSPVDLEQLKSKQACNTSASVCIMSFNG